MTAARCARKPPLAAATSASDGIQQIVLPDRRGPSPSPPEAAGFKLPWSLLGNFQHHLFFQKKTTSHSLNDSASVVAVAHPVLVDAGKTPGRAVLQSSFARTSSFSAIREW